MSILLQLQARGRVSARSLAERLEVSVRTVYRDIDELAAAGVPVIVERGAAGGFELLEGWRTTLTGLTPHESQALFLMGLPGPVAELGLADTMASAQIKLLAALPREFQDEAQRIRSRVHVDLTAWYQRAAPAAHLRVLADAVWTARWVSVRYQSWNGVIERDLEPLGLVIKAGDWYLVARPRTARATPRTYRLSSLRELAVRGGFTRPKSFDLVTYWQESTQRFEREIYRGSADLRLTARGCTLLRGSSAVVADAIDRATDARGGWVHVTIPIESVGHAASQLIALGANVEVDGPEELRTALARMAREVAAIYRRRTKRRPRVKRGAKRV